MHTSSTLKKIYTTKNLRLSASLMELIGGGYPAWTPLYLAHWFVRVCGDTHAVNRRPCCSKCHVSVPKKKRKKKEHGSSSYCLPTHPPFIRHPQGLEAQSPPIAEGHRSPCPWRRQPTYCQLALKTEDISSPAR